MLTHDVAWGGIDTVHILAGVPSTQTLMDIADVPLSPPQATTTANKLQRRTFSGSDDSSSASTSTAELPSQSGLDKVAKEARACGEVNYVGTVLALACFVSTRNSAMTATAMWAAHVDGAT